MNKLLECTRGRWTVGDEKTIYGPTDVLAGRRLIANAGGRSPDPENQNKANAALIAAAFDHVLIWWAEGHGWTFEKNDDGTWFVDCFLGDQPYCAFDDLVGDPFGFPILTDDLRARLLAEMEGAK